MKHTENGLSRFITCKVHFGEEIGFPDTTCKLDYDSIFSKPKPKSGGKLFESTLFIVSDINHRLTEVIKDKYFLHNMDITAHIFHSGDSNYTIDILNNSVFEDDMEGEFYLDYILKQVNNLRPHHVDAGI